MNIIAGICKNMEVKTLEGKDISRPTGNKTRKALASILAPSIIGAKIVDAFSGTGAVGIELLSAGAASCVFIESNKEAFNLLRENLERVKKRFKSSEESEPGIELIQMDVKETFKETFKNKDLVFCDPPYAESMNWFKEFLTAFKEDPSLIPKMIIWESDVKNRLDLSLLDNLLIHKKTKKYGQTEIYIFEKATSL